MYVVVAKDRNLVAAEALEARNLRGLVDDVEAIVEGNQKLKQVIEEKDRGKPGHYYGRDMMLEARMPMVSFLLVPYEFGGDKDWFKDDRKFQEYMKRNPEYSLLHR